MCGVCGVLCVRAVCGGGWQIDVNEISQTVAQLGRGWDDSAVNAFFQAVDKDGTGTITRQEFANFMQSIQSEMSGGDF